MKFRTYRENGALNSPPIFDAFEEGIKNLGHELSLDDDAIPVIWSVLWNGRMSQNKQVYDSSRKAGKPVVIIEVGNFLRNQTWRISVNHINREGLFGNDTDLDDARNKKFNINLDHLRLNRKPEILIACQHQKSLQWAGQPPIVDWVSDVVREIKKYSDRPIKIRPHPRSPFDFRDKNVILEKPNRVVNTYDDFDLNYMHHCVINHNSGVPVQAAIKGIPVICDKSCLAYPVSMGFSDIETPHIPDRDRWLLGMLHTEWFVDEIKEGIPIKRLEKYLL